MVYQTRPSLLSEYTAAQRCSQQRSCHWNSSQSRDLEFFWPQRDPCNVSMSPMDYFCTKCYKTPNQLTICKPLMRKQCHYSAERQVTSFTTPWEHMSDCKVSGRFNQVKWSKLFNSRACIVCIIAYRRHMSVICRCEHIHYLFPNELFIISPMRLHEIFIFIRR